MLLLLVVGLAAAAVVVLVAAPLLRRGGGSERMDAIAPEQRRRLALREERDAALTALRDLEFDHRTGKISDEDYRPLVAEYRRRVAAALQALDPERPAGDRQVRPGSAPPPAADESGAPEESSRP